MTQLDETPNYLVWSSQHEPKKMLILDESDGVTIKNE